MMPHALQWRFRLIKFVVMIIVLVRIAVIVVAVVGTPRIIGGAIQKKTEWSKKLLSLISDALASLPLSLPSLCLVKFLIYASTSTAMRSWSSPLSSIQRFRYEFQSC